MARPRSNYTSRESEEDYKFLGILYPDSESYNCDERLAMMQNSWSEYSYILHDKDVYTITDVDKWNLDHSDIACPFKDGDLKKPHYHFVVKFSSPILLGRAAKILGIPSNDVQRCKSYKSSLRYLIHADNSEKFQYSADSICSNVSKLSSILRSDEDSSFKSRVLYDYISCSPCLKLSDLVAFALDNGCWDELRRGQHIFTALLAENNGGHNNGFNGSRV